MTLNFEKIFDKYLNILKYILFKSSSEDNLRRFISNSVYPKSIISILNYICQKVPILLIRKWCRTEHNDIMIISHFVRFCSKKKPVAAHSICLICYSHFKNQDFLVLLRKSGSTLIKEVVRKVMTVLMNIYGNYFKSLWWIYVWETIINNFWNWRCKFFGLANTSWRWRRNGVAAPVITRA